MSGLDQGQDVVAASRAGSAVWQAGTDDHGIQLGTPMVWCWENPNVHLVKEPADFAEEHKDWLRIFQMPSYAPEPNPADGIWSLFKRRLPDFATADLSHLTRVFERKLKKIQYLPHVIDGCLPPTGLITDLMRSAYRTPGVQPE